MPSAAQPRQLRTVGRPSPLGVAPGTTRFGWLVPETVATQTAYQLRVATDPDRLPEAGDVWDSTPVESQSSTGVTYAGPSLSPRTQYYWVVRVQNADGQWSAWSDPTWFETGPERWTADWIGPTGAAYETTPAPAPVFRTTFDLDSEVESARLYLAAGGTADPRVNGDRITDRALDPGQTDYEERVLYATHDVTDALRAGENALAVVCGRERYAMTTENVWGWHDTPWQRDHPELLAELDVTLADGTEHTIGSDESWQVTPSATRFDSLYSGEVYDAREAAAWSDPTLDTRTWSRARSVTGPAGRLEPQTVQPIEPVRTVTPEHVAEPTDGTYVVDFGEMIAGWTRLSVSAPEGTELRLTHGERLHDDGTVNVDQEHVEERLQTDRYVCAGEGIESWEPRFDYKGFRYVQVDGLPERPSDDLLTAVVAHTTVETGSQSEFECSDDLLTTIHGNSVRALLNNHHHVPTDTPMFEKNGWTGDAQLTAETALYNFDMVPFYRKWLADFADAQRPTGEIPPIVHTSDWGYSDAPHDGGILSPNPGWDAAYVLIPWWTYRYCGARELLAEHYDGMQSIVRFLGTYVEDGVLDEGLGDWLAPGHGEIRSIPPEGPAITSTAYYYRMADVVSDVARVLGHDDDAATFAALADRTAAALNDAFFDADRGRYATGRTDEYRQTSNVFPLAFDIVPDDHRAAVVENLVRDVRDTHDSHLNTGIHGTKYVLQALTENGYTDLAYDVATQRTYPSWGHWIEHGASALYEAWELESRSRDHHMAGSIDEWFYKYLAGVRPAEPAFRTVAFEPYVPTDLDTVEATVDTVRGEIRSAWEQHDDGVRFEFRVPPNASGVARLPGRDPVVSGDPVAADARPTTRRRRDDRVEIELPAGAWSVETSR